MENKIDENNIIWYSPTKEYSFHINRKINTGYNNINGSYSGFEYIITIDIFNMENIKLLSLRCNESDITMIMYNMALVVMDIDEESEYTINASNGYLDNIILKTKYIYNDRYVYTISNYSYIYDKLIDILSIELSTKEIVELAYSFAFMISDIDPYVCTSEEILDTTLDMLNIDFVNNTINKDTN